MWAKSPQYENFCSKLKNFFVGNCRQRLFLLTGFPLFYHQKTIFAQKGKTRQQKTFYRNGNPPLATIYHFGRMSSITLDANGSAWNYLPTKNTSQYLPFQRDAKKARAGSLSVTPDSTMSLTAMSLAEKNLLKETLASIKNHAERNIFFAVYAGTDTRQELLKSDCFSRGTLDHALKSLLSQNLIVKEGKMYRPAMDFSDASLCPGTERTLPESSLSHQAEPLYDVRFWAEAYLDGAIKGQAALDQFFDHMPQEWIPHDAPSFAVLFQSDMFKARIKSTDEIKDILALATVGQWKVIAARRQEVRRYFPERELCDDLVDRIVLLHVTLGIHYDEQFLKNLQSICQQYKSGMDVRDKRERRSFARLSVIIKEIYERMGVRYEEYAVDTDYFLDTEMKRVVGWQYAEVKKRVNPQAGQALLFD